MSRIDPTRAWIEGRVYVRAVGVLGHHHRFAFAIAAMVFLVSEPPGLDVFGFGSASEERLGEGWMGANQRGETHGDVVKISEGVVSGVIVERAVLEGGGGESIGGGLESRGEPGAGIGERAVEVRDERRGVAREERHRGGIIRAVDGAQIDEFGDVEDASVAKGGGARVAGDGGAGLVCRRARATEHHEHAARKRVFGGGGVRAGVTVAGMVVRAAAELEVGVQRAAKGRVVREVRPEGVGIGAEERLEAIVQERDDGGGGGVRRRGGVVVGEEGHARRERTRGWARERRRHRAPMRSPAPTGMTRGCRVGATTTTPPPRAKTLPEARADPTLRAKRRRRVRDFARQLRHSRAREYGRARRPRGSEPGRSPPGDHGDRVATRGGGAGVQLPPLERLRQGASLPGPGTFRAPRGVAFSNAPG